MPPVNPTIMITADDREAVHRANDLFYRAIETLDVNVMDRVWVHDAGAHCVHPRWEAITGWEAVRRSWEHIFSNNSWMRVTPTTVRVEVAADIAVVTCTENITVKSADEVGLTVNQATNLFRKTPEGWRLFHHHASPAPVHVTHPFSGTVQ
jgi:hypothetical protein